MVFLLAFSASAWRQFEALYLSYHFASSRKISRSCQSVQECTPTFLRPILLEFETLLKQLKNKKSN